MKNSFAFSQFFLVSVKRSIEMGNKFIENTMF